MQRCRICDTNCESSLSCNSIPLSSKPSSMALNTCDWIITELAGWFWEWPQLRKMSLCFLRWCVTYHMMSNGQRQSIYNPPLLFAAQYSILQFDLQKTKMIDSWNTLINICHVRQVAFSSKPCVSDKSNLDEYSQHMTTQSSHFSQSAVNELNLKQGLTLQVMACFECVCLGIVYLKQGLRMNLEILLSDSVGDTHKPN